MEPQSNVPYIKITWTTHQECEMSTKKSEMAQPYTIQTKQRRESLKREKKT